MVFTIRRIGNSLGVLLPSKVIEKLRLAEGDELYVAVARDWITLTPYNPGFGRTVELVEETFRSYRNALRALEK